MYDFIFNDFVSGKIPSPDAINQIIIWFNEQRKISPKTKLIGFGSEYGIWEFLLNDAGIPKDSLIAVDGYSKCGKNGQKFYDIIKDENYEIGPNDIFFAHYFNKKKINEYINKGGKCVIILAKDEWIANAPFHYFSQNNEWTVTNVKIVSPRNMNWDKDILSYNIKNNELQNDESQNTKLQNTKHIC